MKNNRFITSQTQTRTARLSVTMYEKTCRYTAGSNLNVFQGNCMEQCSKPICKRHTSAFGFSTNLTVCVLLSPFCPLLYPFFVNKVELEGKTQTCHWLNYIIDSTWQCKMSEEWKRPLIRHSFCANQTPIDWSFRIRFTRITFGVAPGDAAALRRGRCQQTNSRLTDNHCKPFANLK